MSDGIVMPTNPKFKNRIGERYGKLIVIGYAGRTGKLKRPVWKVRCDCGTEQLASIDALRGGRGSGRKSCGCTSRIVSHPIERHGMMGTREYRIWIGIKTRCFNKYDKHFPRYGGRGISMCDRWRDSFESFFKDMGEAPTPNHSIDRIDNEGHYEPGNCRWATNREQGRNRRTNRLLTVNGETLCMMDWAIRIGITFKQFTFRLRKGWTPEEVVAVEVNQHPVIQFHKNDANRLIYWRGWEASRRGDSKESCPYKKSRPLAFWKYWNEGFVDYLAGRSRYESATTSPQPPTKGNQE